MESEKEIKNPGWVDALLNLIKNKEEASPPPNTNETSNKG